MGLAALLATSAAAFTTVKVAGAAYLIYLGIQSLRASRGSLADVAGAGGRPAPLPPATAFRQGLTTNLLNPKAALFFTALLPQFVAPQDPAAVFAAMTLIASAASLAGLSLYAALVARGAHMLRRPSVARRLDRVTGAVFIALGVRVALEKR